MESAKEKTKKRKEYSFGDREIREFLQNASAQQRLEVQEYVDQLGLTVGDTKNRNEIMKLLRNNFSGNIELDAYEYNRQNFSTWRDSRRIPFVLDVKTVSLLDESYLDNYRNYAVYLFDRYQNKWAVLLPSEILEALVKRDFVEKRKSESTSKSVQTRLYF